MSETREVLGEPASQSNRNSWGLGEALGAARALLSFPPDQCKNDPRAKAWIASLESLLNYAHQCHAPASSAPTIDAGTTVPTLAPPKEVRPENPHGKKPMEFLHEGTGQSSNPRRRSREEMEDRAGPHLQTCSTPYPVTVLDLYRLEQETGETLRHYIWRFWGVIDCIPPADLREVSVIAVFHVNVRNLNMREKLSLHAVDTLEDLWSMADRCAREEEALNLPPRQAR